MQEELAGRDRLIASLQRELALCEERLTTIEHELHDGPLQRVIAARMQIQAMLGTPGLPAQQAELLEELDQSLEQAVGQVRNILQTDAPTPLLNTGGLEGLCHEFSEPGFEVVLDGESIIAGLEADVSEAVDRIVRELVWNARKHSQAQRVTVTVRLGKSEWLVEVDDAGCGFDPGNVPEESFGLCTAIQRARTYGLELVVDSVRGEGTRVTLKGAL
ncbi:MAG: hypothetical protein CMJ79_12545 [Planctomycetaceae bacterium]|nr:hypothetical protein [Planctomycetaceae bacterium]|tara:strand:- start:7498 stop:8148 length:651 start_codon:yes stop_codon:yes gene_type:complete